ncbi:IspD/TarI family cytidylyltransferase [Desulfobacterium sp. N47]|uniref:2-C-methyl-D-erythritol 4-phosphate cytidylyltransferase n=1 Tax=uncultured Desulfobacterium sp. TaxID=201089 RepID=E1Y9X6_9BACT|nr:2-C-methyl-D-erythritol 4-phosphate cytidylyltransferase [uncultured Desulfobacterium sp.]
MVYAIIVAAGKGVRMNSPIRKQFFELDGRPLLCITLKAFDLCTLIESIILVVPPEDFQYCIDQVINPLNLKNKIKLVKGGPERQDSVYNGLLAVDEKDALVVIHDGVRPFVSSDLIGECIRQALLHKACILGWPASDTIKVSDDTGYIKKTLSRDLLWSAQTPQAFDYRLIKKAHDTARKQGYTGTDDAQLVEMTGEKVKIIQGSKNNIKITTKEDFILAQAILNLNK